MYCAWFKYLFSTRWFMYMYQVPLIFYWIHAPPKIWIHVHISHETWCSICQQLVLSLFSEDLSLWYMYITFLYRAVMCSTFWMSFLKSWYATSLYRVVMCSALLCLKSLYTTSLYRVVMCSALLYISLINTERYCAVPSECQKSCHSTFL